jgi:hypothetical protein
MIWLFIDVTCGISEDVICFFSLGGRMYMHA